MPDNDKLGSQSPSQSTPRSPLRSADRAPGLSPELSRYRSKTIAAWLALLAGTVGAHRFYLNGPRDGLAWLYPLPTLVGVYGLLRMKALGVEDTLGWLLVPLLGLMISVAMLSAIVYALMPDAKWMARHNPGLPPDASRGTGFVAVLAAILALLLGGAALMATIAFSAQKFFEWELATQQAAVVQDTRSIA